jgi:multidrug resistance protein
MVFAPMSEMVGRRPVYAITLLMAVIFVIPCAVSKNIGTLIVCRLIDGIAFSAPMTLVGGTLADMWKNEERGVPMAAFSAAPFIGPAIGPLAGGFLADNCGWRWLYWLQLILSFVAWILITFTVPETYAPVLLKKRAAKQRKAENDEKYTTEADLSLPPFPATLPGANCLLHCYLHVGSLWSSVHVLRRVPHCLPGWQGLERLDDGFDVHPTSNWCCYECRMCTIRQ